MDQPKIFQSRTKIVIFYLSLFLFTFFCFIRVPFIGSYIDGVFDYIIGWNKYFIYIYIFTYLFLRILNVRLIEHLYRKRTLVFIFVFFLALGLSISCSVWEFSNEYNGAATTFTNIIVKYNNASVNYLKSHDYSSFFSIASGGIISDILYAVFKTSLIAVIYIVSIIGIFIAISILIGKKNYKFIVVVKNKIIEMLGGHLNTQGDQSSEMAIGIDDVIPRKVTEKAILYEIEEKKEEITPPTIFLDDTSVNRKTECIKYFENIKDLLVSFFASKQINLEYISLETFPLYTEVFFVSHEKDIINLVLKEKFEISQKLGINTFNLGIDDKNIIFEFKNPDNLCSKISLLNILSEAKLQSNSLQCAFGVNIDDSIPFVYDISKNRKTIIIGNKGSGATMLTSIIFASLIFNNSPDVIDINFIGNESDTLTHNISKYSHLKIIKQSDAEIFLSDLVTLEKEPTKQIFVLINEFDAIIRENPELEGLIEKLVNVKSNKISFVLTSSSVNDKSTKTSIYEKIDNRFILRLFDESESIIAIGDNKGMQLCGNGDGYYVHSKDDPIRFQTCYLNQKELQVIIGTCNSFYKQKEKYIAKTAKISEGE